MEFNLGLFVLWSHTDGSLSMFITSEAQQNIMLYSAYMLSPVRLSVCPSHGWTIQKRLKLGLWNFHHTEAPSSGRIIVYDGARKIWRAIASLENLFLRRWGPLRSHISGSKKACNDSAGNEVDKQQQARRQLKNYTNTALKLIVFSDITLPDCLKFSTLGRLFEHVLYC